MNHFLLYILKLEAIALGILFLIVAAGSLYGWEIRPIFNLLPLIILFHFIFVLQLFSIKYLAIPNNDSCPKKQLFVIASIIYLGIDAIFFVKYLRDMFFIKSTLSKAILNIPLTAMVIISISVILNISSDAIEKPRILKNFFTSYAVVGLCFFTIMLGGLIGDIIDLF